MRALIIVDMQKDFCDYGVLKTIGSIEMASKLKQFVLSLNRNDWFFVYSKDCHPHNHCSFDIYRPHCIKGTIGYEYFDELKDLSKDFEIKKGTKRKVDSYSAFFENERYHSKLNRILQEKKIKDVYVCGLVKDICVIETAIDAANFGYNTFIVEDFTIALDEKTFKNKMNSRIKLINSKSLK